MDSLESISIAIVLVVTVIIFTVYKVITSKNNVLEAENELLKMKVKAYEVFEDIQNSDVDSIVRERNGRRNKSDG